MTKGLRPRVSLSSRASGMGSGHTSGLASALAALTPWGGLVFLGSVAALSAPPEASTDWSCLPPGAVDGLGVLV
jgi:hypothetical protein